MPHPTHEPTTHLRLSRDMSELVRVREWLAEQLASRGLGPPEAQDAVLMANELVVNVIMHTAADPVVALTHRDAAVRIAVHDDDPGHPVLEAADPRRPRGNGLRIIDTWASAWGVEPDGGGGKWVWFTVDG